MKTVYLFVTENQDGGYRLSLADGPHRTRFVMQSRRYDMPSKAKQDAIRLFGNGIRFQDPKEFGIQLSFVVAVATFVCT